MSSFFTTLVQIFSKSVLIIVLISCSQVQCKNQYVSPLNMGMKTSVSYDIANLLTRFPVRGAIAVGLACCILKIIFFGIITAPFGYFFGIPSQKYVLGDMEFAPPSPIAASRMDYLVIDSPHNFSTLRLMAAPRALSVQPEDSQTWRHFVHEKLETFFQSESQRSANDGTMTKIFLDIIWKLYLDLVAKMDKPHISSVNVNHNPSILDSMFSFMPKSGSVRTKQCELLTVCYAHGALRRTPSWLIKIYHVFSGKLAFMPQEFKRAVLYGMENQEKCLEHYSDCSETPFNIVLKTVLNWLPKGAFSGSPKRKQAMYM